MSEIRVLLLDLDDTIIRERDYFDQVLNEFANGLGINVRSGITDNFDEVRLSVPDILGVYLAHLGLNSSLHEQFFKAYKGVSGFLQPVEGASELIQTALDCGWEVSILTNGVGDAQLNKWRLLELPNKDFVKFFPARSLGADKPSPRTFEEWRSRIGCAWENVLSVGDKPKVDLEYPASKGATCFVTGSSQESSEFVHTALSQLAWRILNENLD